MEDPIDRFTLVVRSRHERGLTRRELLRRGIALGLSLPTIAAVLAACGEAPTPPQSAAAPAPTAAPAAAATAPAPIAQAAATATAPAVPTAAPPTATAAPPTPSAVAAVRFAVIGDFGLAGEPAQAVADLVHSWQPDFVVSTGDNNYPHGAAATIDENIGQYYRDYIHPYRGRYGAGSATRRFFPVLGNHDWDGGTPAPYLDYFDLPDNERYYSVAWGDVRLFALDSALDEPDGVQANSPQAQWLQAALAEATERWKIVCMHHPPFSSGHHGSSAWMQWPYRAWGADFVLAGHDHSYERVLRDGLPYFINGLGGGSRYAPGSTTVAGSATFYNRDHGAMLIEVAGARATCQFVTRAGEVIDTYTLDQA